MKKIIADLKKRIRTIDGREYIEFVDIESTLKQVYIAGEKRSLKRSALALNQAKINALEENKTIEFEVDELLKNMKDGRSAIDEEIKLLK